MLTPRTRIIRLLLLIVLVLAASGTPAFAQTFSADVVVAKPDGAPSASPGRVYVSGRKVRLEVPGLPDGFFLIDADRRTALFVRPRRHIFMDAKQSSRLTQVLIPAPPDAACGEWRIMEGIAGAAEWTDGWQCALQGEATIDGRTVLEYRAASRAHHASRWIDPERRFPVKTVDEDGTVVTLDHIKDGPQSPDLFIIPDDYRRLDPLQLIEQIKQSDVWVEPPP